MVSAINNQDKVRFHVYDRTMNADVLIDFMKRLIKDADRKVILILDNLRVHHAKVVRAWLEDHREMIEVFYLPSYSPVDWSVLLVATRYDYVPRGALAF